MKESPSASKLVITVLISAGIAIVSAVLLLLAFAALSVSAEDPLSLVKPLSLVALGLASVVCGVASSCLNRRSELPCYLLGSISGAVLVVILFSLSFVSIESGTPMSGTLKASVYGGVVVLSLLGALLARPRGRKHARVHIKRRRVRR